MEAYKVVGILSLLAVVGCVHDIDLEAVKQMTAEDLVAFLSDQKQTPEIKKATLLAYPNQDLKLKFYPYDPIPVGVFTTMCQPTVAKCESAPIPLQARSENRPGLRQLADYCAVTKQREYCRDNLDRLVWHLMDRVDDQLQYLMTGFVRYYKEREAAVDSAEKAQVSGTSEGAQPSDQAEDGLMEAEAAEAKQLDNIYLAFVDIMKEKFEESSKSLRDQEILLNQVESAALKFNKIYDLFQVLTDGNTKTVEPHGSEAEWYKMLLTDWRKAREVTRGFLTEVYGMFAREIVPKVDRAAVFHLAEGGGPTYKKFLDLLNERKLASQDRSSASGPAS